jgi:TPR repeat protein
VGFRDLASRAAELGNPDAQYMVANALARRDFGPWCRNNLLQVL